MLKRLLLSLYLLSGVAIAADPAPEGPAFSKPVVGISDASDLKGIKKVAIASFVVQFVVKQTEEMVIDLERQLTGDPEFLQAITEQMYRDFQASVQGAGFELVAHDTVVATKEYRTMQEKSSPSPLLMDGWKMGSKTGAYKSVFLAPKGIIINLKDDYEEMRKSYSGFSSHIVDETLTFSGRMEQYTTNWKYYDKDLQKALDASTLHVRIYVPIAYLWSSTSKAGPWTHYNSGAMAAVRLGERFTRLSVGKDGDIAKIYLTEPVMTRGITEAKLKSESTNFLGKITRDVEWEFKPDAYRTLIPGATQQTLKSFLDKMKESS